MLAGRRLSQRDSLMDEPGIARHPILIPGLAGQRCFIEHRWHDWQGAIIRLPPTTAAVSTFR